MTIAAAAAAFCCTLAAGGGSAAPLRSRAEITGKSKARKVSQRDSMTLLSRVAGSGSAPVIGVEPSPTTAGRVLQPDKPSELRYSEAHLRHTGVREHPAGECS